MTWHLTSEEEILERFLLGESGYMSAIKALTLVTAGLYKQHMKAELKAISIPIVTSGFWPPSLKAGGCLLLPALRENLQALASHMDNE